MFIVAVPLRPTLMKPVSPAMTMAEPLVVDGVVRRPVDLTIWSGVLVGGGCAPGDEEPSLMMSMVPSRSARGSNLGIR
jgi:hypothetical protein